MTEFRQTPEGVSPRPWRVEKDARVDGWGIFVPGVGFIGNLSRKTDIEHITHMANNWDAMGETAAQVERAESLVATMTKACELAIAEHDALLAERAELRALLEKAVSSLAIAPPTELCERIATGSKWDHAARALLARTGDK